MNHPSVSAMTSYLSLLYNGTYMPMYYIRHQQVCAFFPDWSIPSDIILTYKNAIAREKITFDYFITEESLYMGIVRNTETDEDVIIGPVSTIPVSAGTIQTMAAAYGLEETDRARLEEFFQRTPTFSLYQFLNILALIHKELNGEIIDVFATYRNVHSDIEDLVGRSHSSALMERKEHERYHDTYYFELEYCSMVEKGDLQGLEALLRTVPAITEGQVAPDCIRQAKNIFIVTISQVTRSAIRGGLDIETAYQLSDSYIQEVEKMSEPHAITLLSANAIFDFTGRVADSKIPQGMSQEIFLCLQYISNHVNSNISSEMIAEELNMERSTLSKKFKRELGFNISTYIMRRKLEEAKSLLHYTDKSISEISEFLCFSSQSYFQNVFKKKYGMTPKEFRKGIK